MEIKLYWRKNCGQCKMVMDYFEEKQTKIEKIDVSFDQEKFDEMLRLGGIATPLIVIGNHIIHSFDREKIEKALEELE